MGNIFYMDVTLLPDDARKLTVLSTWLKLMVKCFMKPCWWIFLSSCIRNCLKKRLIYEETKTSIRRGGLSMTLLFFFLSIFSQIFLNAIHPKTYRFFA
jgi:hypothetical protein